MFQNQSKIEMSKENVALWLLAAFLVTVALVSAIGCTDASFSRITAIGNKHRVELWSGGKKVKTWTSTGKVQSEANSDGYYFCDAETGKLVRVTGDLVITVID